MENKEFQFKGATLGGFTMLFANILLTLLSIALIVLGILQESNEVLMWLLIGIGAVVLVSTFFYMGWLCDARARRGTCNDVLRKI